LARRTSLHTAPRVPPQRTGWSSPSGGRSAWGWRRDSRVGETGPCSTARFPRGTDEPERNRTPAPAARDARPASVSAWTGDPTCSAASSSCRCLSPATRRVRSSRPSCVRPPPRRRVGAARPTVSLTASTCSTCTAGRTTSSRPSTPSSGRALGARLGTRAALPAIDPGFNTQASSRLFDGEWDYDLQWRPERGFPVHSAWLDAVLDGHARVADGLDIGVPVLVMLSSRSWLQPSWSPRIYDSDVALDVDGVAERATRLGRHVSVVR